MECNVDTSKPAQSLLIVLIDIIVPPVVEANILGVRFLHRAEGTRNEKKRLKWFEGDVHVLVEMFQVREYVDEDGSFLQFHPLRRIAVGGGDQFYVLCIGFFQFIE